MTRRTRDILWLCWTFGTFGSVVLALALSVVWLAMVGVPS